MSFDLDAFMFAHQHTSDHALLFGVSWRNGGRHFGAIEPRDSCGLEVMARCSLLPLVDGARRAGARGTWRGRLGWWQCGPPRKPSAATGPRQPWKSTQRRVLFHENERPHTATIVYRLD